MSTPLIATAAVIVFLIIFIIFGIYRGFLRIILTTFSLVITLVLAGTLAGTLADFVENGTVIGPRLEKHIEEYVSAQFESVSGTATNVQNSFIDALPLTTSMKTDLKERNTLAGYVDQGVDSFSQYLAVNLSTIIIKLLSYVVLFIVIYLLIRIILRLCNLINHIPVLGGINRFLGGVFGLVEGVLFLWVICLIIMMMSGTPFGITCEQVIHGSTALTFIYEHNLLMSILNGVTGLIHF